jgi:ATP-dependent protease ClpP protease subunit
MGEIGRTETPTERRELLMTPNVKLYGPIGDTGVQDCLKQIQTVLQGDKPLVFELTTEGGDAEGGRRIALEIRLAREWHGRETIFIGKTVVMSAGVTIMAAFPRENRYLTRDAVLLIHERRLQKTLELNGPMRADLQIVRETVALLESAQRTEREGFAELAAGSRMSVDELYERALTNCYLTAEEALEKGLVAAIV